MDDKIVKFKTWDCRVELATYSNGNTAIRLVDYVDGSPVAIATTNLGEVLPKDQAYIKDYSENEGMLDALKDAGVVVEVIHEDVSGFVTFPLCRLSIC